MNESVFFGSGAGAARLRCGGGAGRAARGPRGLRRGERRWRGRGVRRRQREQGRRAAELVAQHDARAVVGRSGGCETGAPARGATTAAGTDGKSEVSYMSGGGDGGEEARMRSSIVVGAGAGSVAGSPAAAELQAPSRRVRAGERQQAAPGGGVARPGSLPAGGRAARGREKSRIAGTQQQQQQHFFHFLLGRHNYKQQQQRG